LIALSRIIPAILGLDENTGLSTRDAAVNPLYPFKPRIAGIIPRVFIGLEIVVHDAS
jgi:hypothetical protein